LTSDQADTADKADNLYQENPPDLSVPSITLARVRCRFPKTQWPTPAKFFQFIFSRYSIARAAYFPRISLTGFTGGESDQLKTLFGGGWQQ
jgi:hypothetical protein